MSSLVALTLATTMMTLPVDCMDKIGKVLHSNDFFKFMCVNKSAARSLKIQAQQRRHSWAQALYLLSFIKAFVVHQGFVLLEDILEGYTFERVTRLAKYHKILYTKGDKEHLGSEMLYAKEDKEHLIPEGLQGVWVPVDRVTETRAGAPVPLSTPAKTILRVGSVCLSVSLQSV